MANDLVEWLRWEASEKPNPEKLSHTMFVAMTRMVSLFTEAATHIESQDKRIEALTGALRPILNRVREIEDKGPCGEGWQSDELIAEIAAADAALSGTTPAPDAQGSGESGNG